MFVRYCAIKLCSNIIPKKIVWCRCANIFHLTNRLRYYSQSRGELKPNILPDLYTLITCDCYYFFLLQNNSCVLKRRLKYLISLKMFPPIPVQYRWYTNCYSTTIFQIAHLFKCLNRRMKGVEHFSIHFVFCRWTILVERSLIISNRNPSKL